MNVASMELCKELYELSHWTLTEKHWYDGKPISNSPWGWYCSAYDLGFLLEKLPQNTWVGYVDTSGQRGYALAKTYAWNEQGNDIDKIAECRADTLEDAACKLVIELFKRGSLVRRIQQTYRDVVGPVPLSQRLPELLQELQPAPGTTQEEIGQIKEGILAIAAGTTEHYTWEEKIESLVTLAKAAGRYINSEETDLLEPRTRSDYYHDAQRKFREAYADFCEWRHEEPYVVDEIKGLLEQTD